MAGCDDSWLCQEEEGTNMPPVPTVFPFPSPQPPPVFPSCPTGLDRQRNSTNHSNPPQEMSPGHVQISCAANPPAAAQGAGSDAQLWFFNAKERGVSSGGMCEIVAGGLSTNAAALCSPPRQLPTDPGTGSFGDSPGWALDYQQMSPCFVFLSQSPPQAQSPTLSGSVEYIGVGGLWNFDDDGHTGTPLGISTCTASTNLDVAAGRQQLTGCGENPVSALRLEDNSLNRFDEGLRREVAHDIGELKGSFLASGRRLLASVKRRSAASFHFRMEISSDRMQTAICRHCAVVFRTYSYGTSRLYRHIVSAHPMHLGARSDALKRHQSLSFPEPERGKKKECVENPMQGSISPKCIESKHVDIGPGHVSENQIQGTTKSKSEVGFHFTKEVHGQGSGIVKAKCQQCKSVQGDVLERQQSLCFLELEKGTKKQCTENSMLQGSDRNQYIDSSKHLEVAPGALSGKQVVEVTGRSRGCLVRRPTRHKSPHLRRSKRPPHLQRRKCGALRQVRRPTKHALRANVWKYHFTVEYVANKKGSSTRMGRCRYCDTLLKADPKINGTSRLGRHTKEVHKITKDMNEEKSTNQEIEPGDVSRKQILLEADIRRSKSEAWDHFQMEVDVKGSGIVKAMCRYCDVVLEVDSITNDTCLLSHITVDHRIKSRKHIKEEKSRNDSAPSDSGQRRHISSETRSSLGSSAKQNVVMHNKLMRKTSEGNVKQGSSDKMDSTTGADKNIMKLLLDNRHYDHFPQEYDLSEQDKLAIDVVRKLPDKTKVVDINGEFIWQHQIQCLLDPEEFLLDVTLNAYIGCLRSKTENLVREDGKVYLEVTFVASMFKELGTRKAVDEFLLQRSKTYLEHEMIFLPVNVKNTHWYLAVVNSRKRKIQILDSLCRSHNRRDILETLRGIQNCFEALLHSGDAVHNWTDLDVTSWVLDEVFLDPIQKDGVSCGLFTIKFAELWTGSKLSVDITQDQMVKFRLKLLAVLVLWKTNTLDCYIDDLHASTESSNPSDCVETHRPEIYSRAYHDEAKISETVETLSSLDLIMSRSGGNDSLQTSQVRDLAQIAVESLERKVSMIPPIMPLPKGRAGVLSAIDEDEEMYFDDSPIPDAEVQDIPPQVADVAKKEAARTLSCMGCESPKSHGDKNVGDEPQDGANNHDALIEISTWQPLVREDLLRLPLPRVIEVMSMQLLELQNVSNIAHMKSVELDSVRESNDNQSQIVADLETKVKELESAARETALTQTQKISVLEAEIKSIQDEMNKLSLTKKELETANVMLINDRTKLSRENDELKSMKVALENKQSEFVTLFTSKFLEFNGIFSSVLGAIGAEGHSLDINLETFSMEPFFDWLNNEIGLLPDIVRGVNEFGAKVCFEGMAKMLESLGCEHLRELGKKQRSLPNIKLNEPTKISTVISNRLVRKFWHPFGQSETQQRFLAKLAKARELELLESLQQVEAAHRLEEESVISCVT